MTSGLIEAGLFLTSIALEIYIHATINVITDGRADYKVVVSISDLSNLVSAWTDVSASGSKL